jgi:hypothetical protein
MDLAGKPIGVDPPAIAAILKRVRAPLLLGLAVLAGPARADDVGDPIQELPRAVPACDPARAHCVAIHVHVAGVSADWIARQIAAANRHFAALDLGFQLAGVDALPASAEHVAERADRDALAKLRAGSPAIDVFFVAQLDDIDRADAQCGGVTWRAPRDGSKYLIVSAHGFDRTLAHELGHFFGLPHSSYAISIMNKAERTEPPSSERRFADEEIAAMRPVLRQLLREHVIADVR